MADLSGLLSGLLSDEDALSGLLSLLGGAGGPAQPPPAPKDAADSLRELEQTAGIDLDTVIGLQKFLSGTKTDDKNISLLRALKPHLSPERAARADDAIKVLQLLDLLPLVQSLGLFGGDQK
ncbi:MAG: hypothetical protein PHD67_03650 [Oscillospiraceae bacterium]|nr:hypothetical protein [Oscillospiraceae bacterium]